MLCIHCGHWNDAAEKRCSHCGRRVERTRQDTWERSGLEPDRRAARASAGAASAEMPPPAPQWKKQLDLKLDTYRSRQKAGLHAAAKAETARGLTPLPERSAEPNIISFDRGAGRTAPPDEAEPLPSLDADTGAGRRSGLQTATPESKLPPLRRGIGPIERAPERPLPAENEQIQAAGPEDDASHLIAAPIRLRAMAGLLDLALVLVALGVFVGALHVLGDTISPDGEGMRALGGAFFGILTFYWILYLRYIGETAGMHWLGLHVVGFNGQAPGDSQRWARAIGTILSTAAVGLGFVWSMADEDRLTWHDRLSKTFVTRARPARRPTEGSSRRVRRRRQALTKAAQRA